MEGKIKTAIIQSEARVAKGVCGNWQEIKSNTKIQWQK